MEVLAKHIADRLSTHPYCTVFDSHISRVFPMTEKEADRRDAAIRAFAAERGWTAKIFDPGIRVTFRKAV